MSVDWKLSYQNQLNRNLDLEEKIDSLTLMYHDKIAEIERLREALEKIAARDLQSIAKRALDTRDPEVQFHLLTELAQYDMQAIAIDALAPGTRVPPAWVSG